MCLKVDRGIWTANPVCACDSHDVLNQMSDELTWFKWFLSNMFVYLLQSFYVLLILTWANLLIYVN